MKTTEIEARRIARRLGEAEGVRITEIVSRRTGDEGWVCYLREGVSGDMLAGTVAVLDRCPEKARFLSITPEANDY